MEGTYKDQVQTPEDFKANPNIKHVTKSIIQMHLEHLSKGHNYLARKLVPVSNHPQIKYFFSYCLN